MFKMIYKEMPGGWLRMLWPIAWSSLLSYLVIASSSEFSSFAPVPVPGSALYLVAFLGGMLVPLSDGKRDLFSAFWLVLLVASIPALVYGVALVSLWLTVQGTAFWDLIFLWGIQKMFATLLTTGTLVATGGLVSTFLSNIIS